MALSAPGLGTYPIRPIEAGALGVGWVVAFPQADRFGGDKAFADALAGTNSVIAMFENDNGQFPPTGTVILGDGIPIQAIEAQGVIGNVPELAKQLPGIGSCTNRCR